MPERRVAVIGARPARQPGAEEVAFSPPVDRSAGCGDIATLTRGALKWRYGHSGHALAVMASRVLGVQMDSSDGSPAEPADVLNLLAAPTTRRPS